MKYQVIAPLAFATIVLLSSCNQSPSPTPKEEMATSGSVSAETVPHYPSTTTGVSESSITPGVDAPLHEVPIQKTNRP